MTQETVLEWGRQSMWLIIQVAGPIVGAGLTVGVVIGIFQAATQVQEQSLTFVPKMGALMGVLLVSGGWMMTQMIEFTRKLILSMPDVLRYGMELQPWFDTLNARLGTVLLLFIRFGGLMVATPLLNSRSVPIPVKAGLSAILAVTVAPVGPTLHGMEMPLFMASAAKEAGIGLLLGWTTSLIFSAVQMAGEWLDLQGGLQAAAVFNPSLDAQTAPLASFMHVLAGLVFFTSGAYAVVIRAAAASVQISPPGSFQMHPGGPEAWIPLLMSAFWLAVQIAAPIAGALFLAEIAIALGNRVLPQMNVMMLAMPAKTLLAVGLMATTLPALGGILQNAFRDLGTDLLAVLRLVGG